MSHKKYSCSLEEALSEADSIREKGDKPTVEVDTEAGAAYIRFSKGKVHRTKMMLVAFDLDRSGKVLGAEILASAPTTSQSGIFATAKRPSSNAGTRRASNDRRTA